MTADQYVLGMVRKYKVSTAPGSSSDRIGRALALLTKDWAGQCFAGVRYSGFYAKDTAITLASDLDPFISALEGAIREPRHNSE